MQVTLEIRLAPAVHQQEEAIVQALAKNLGVTAPRIRGKKLLRRSLDARKGSPVYQLRYEVWVDEQPVLTLPPVPEVKNVSAAEEVHIIGAGPAGMFAALRLIELGLKPVIWERGKAVRDRRRDLASLTREGIVHPDSNYCFGEGGAGTFSDGKLYTRSDKRGDIRSVLESLVAFGATDEILIDAHPHIGTNKLPAIIQNMREFIRSCGGEVHFESRVTGIGQAFGQVSFLEINGNERINAQKVILATGHSARDIFTLLHREGILIEAKPFALGVRAEHPQAIIDEIQYHCRGPRGEGLPAASYAQVVQAEGRGVYSFCMCPGGIICPAATAPGEIVVNGWSPSMRNTGFANSGMVVEIQPSDWKSDSPLAAMEYQMAIEQRAWQAGGGPQVAPALRLTDFISGKLSATLPDCSYLPGIIPADLNQVLPATVHTRLRQAFEVFGKRMKGFVTSEAIVVAPESRTSSPVRIPRDKDSLQHPGLSGLYPCGEGAGYAGGIMSAALDGLRVADKIAVEERR